MTHEQALEVLEHKHKVADDYVRYGLLNDDHCSEYHEGLCEGLAQAIEVFSELLLEN